MTIYTLTSEETDVGKSRRMTRQNTTRYGHLLRYSRPVKRRNLSGAQLAAGYSLSHIAQAWTNELTAAQKLQWGTASNDLVNRSGVEVAKNRFTRWVQVQMPIHYAGNTPEPTGTARDQVQVQALAISGFEMETQRIVVYWEVKRTGPDVERLAVNVSQVPPQYIGRDHLWKYAGWIGTLDRELELGDDNWHPQEADFVLRYAVELGDLLQLYVRINHFRNDNPPVSTQLSHETTEDWTTLIVTII